MSLLSRLFFKIVPRIRSPFKTKRLLIIRVDAIGDYILFRNFFETLSTDKYWKDYKVTLLGNNEFRGIAEALDKSYVDEFIWIDPLKLDGLGYFLWTIAKLKLKGFDVAVNPISTRGTFHENLLFFSGAKRFIGDSGFEIGREHVKRFKDEDYDMLINAPDYSHFQFYRNRAFFWALTGRKDDTKLTVPFKKSKYIDPSKENIVIVPGASHPSRQWSPSSFASAINGISGDRIFIIAGSNSETQLASEVKQHADVPVLDLTGKTSLIDFIDLIGSCQLLISNETSAVHIAAATKTKTICISNGNHFHRFHPYPPEVFDKITTLYPTEDFYSTDEHVINGLVEACKIRSEFDINLITVDRVVKAIQKEIA